MSMILHDKQWYINTLEELVGTSLDRCSNRCTGGCSCSKKIEDQEKQFLALIDEIFADNEHDIEERL